MVKKIFAAFIAMTLLFSFTPVMDIVTQDDSTVEAKRMKSGKGGFKSPNKSNFQNTKKQEQKPKQDQTKNKQTANQQKKGGMMGGLMGGLLFGGLAGLLFGSLFANMGAMGAIFGFLINMLAIVAVIMLVRYLFKKYIAYKVEQEKNRTDR